MNTPAPDETLLTTTGNKSTNVYHTNPECPRLTHPNTGNVREITLRKNPFLEPCSWCEGNPTAEGDE